MNDSVSTIIRPTNSIVLNETTSTYEPKPFSSDRMVYVNIDSEGNPREKYANTWCAIQGVSFINDKNVFPKGRCVLLSYGAEFDRVLWFNFVQAVASRGEYSDGKTVHNCTAFNDIINLPELASQLFDFSDDLYVFGTDPKNILKQSYEKLKIEFKNPDNKNKYVSIKSILVDTTIDESEKTVVKLLLDRYYVMFNLGGLGDQLKVSHNHVRSATGKILFLDLCGGGVVNDNILNGDVYIHNSKGISYFSNHTENGGQIVIKDSVVDLSSNYIEKGTRCSLVLEGNEKSRCVVKSTNNVFSVISREVYEADGNLEDIDKTVERFTNLSEYDVQLNDQACLSIENTYRVDIVVGFDPVIPFGIKIKKSNDESFEEFNNHSYFCSQHSAILPNFKVCASRTIKQLNSPDIDQAMKISWVKWLIPSGRYSYFYEIIWDRPRLIYKVIGATHFFSFTDPIDLTYSGHGVLLSFRGLECGNQCMVRLHRNKINAVDHNKVDLHEFVDLPYSGANMTYDNGISIAGFKWAEYPSTEPAPSLSLAIFDTFSYNDGRVSAWAMTKPRDMSAWKTGDMLYNVGKALDWTQLIIK